MLRSNQLSYFGLDETCENWEKSLAAYCGGSKRWGGIVLGERMRARCLMFGARTSEMWNAVFDENSSRLTAPEPRQGASLRGRSRCRGGEKGRVLCCLLRDRGCRCAATPGYSR